jgi:hypothetical protein
MAEDSADLGITERKRKGPVSGRSVGLVPQGHVPAQKCSARRSNGEPCKRWAIIGGTVCPTHGGSAPQTRAAAHARIAALAPAAFHVMHAALSEEGVPWAVRVRAAQDILDRSGLKVADEHVLYQGGEAPRADLDSAIEAALAQRSLLPPT